MIIADTSILIEYFRGNDPYFSVIDSYLQKAQIIGLPWIFGELYQGAKNSKEIEAVDLLWKSILKPEFELLESVWIRAGKESAKGKWIHKGIGLIDAAIIESAVKLQIPIWTLDKKLSEVLRFKRVLFKISHLQL